MKGATSIQERLWELRKDKGLNLEELSKLTGISKSALGNYEKEDYKEINHGNLILLADFYGVSLDYLFCRTENRAEINTPLRELHLSDKMVVLLKMFFLPHLPYIHQAYFLPCGYPACPKKRSVRAHHDTPSESGFS